MRDEGNKYGEPVVAGFTRSFGQVVPSGERYEWIKPVMFTAGVGLLDDRHSTKGQPEVGMVVCKIGGPAYRIGRLVNPWNERSNFILVFILFLYRLYYY